MLALGCLRPDPVTGFGIQRPGAGLPAAVSIFIDSGAPEKHKLNRSRRRPVAPTGDERRLVVTDYFLNEDAGRKAHAERDHKVHMATVAANDLRLDPKFRLDMNTAVSTGPGAPARRGLQVAELARRGARR